MNPYNYNQLVFDKSTKNIHGEKTISSTKAFGKSG
jgi:hypothetical protein